MNVYTLFIYFRTKIEIPLDASLSAYLSYCFKNVYFEVVNARWMEFIANDHNEMFTFQ